MRALTLTSFGGLDGVVLTDAAEPEMPDDAVTVRVHAVALAKWDVTTTEGVFVAMGGVTTFRRFLAGTSPASYPRPDLRWRAGNRGTVCWASARNRGQGSASSQSSSSCHRP